MNIEVLDTIYYGIFVFFYVLFILHDTRQMKSIENLFLIITGCFLIFFTGLRWETGTDWGSYSSLFRDIDITNFNSKVFYHYDYGYRIINVLVKIFTDRYTVFLLVDSAVAIGLVYYSIKDIKVDRLCSIVFFYANHYISFYMGANRLIIAMGCTLLGMVCVYHNEKLKALVMGGLAFLFHRSSFIFFVLFLVPKKIFRMRQTVLILLFSYIVGACQWTANILNLIAKCLYAVSLDRYANIAIYYLINKNEELGPVHFAMASTKRIVICLFLYVFYKLFAEKKSKCFEYFYNIYIISVCIYLFFNGLGVFQVLSAFFALSEIVVWGSLVGITSCQNKLILNVCIYVLLTLEIVAAFPAYFDYYIPYRSVIS